MYGAVAFRLGFVGVFPRAGSGVCMDQRDDTLASLGEVNDRLMAKNHALAKALNRATQELAKAKAQLNQLAGPPMTFATMVRVHSARTDEQGVQHASVEVISGTRRMIVPVAANVQASRLEAGRTVLLNENMVVVSQADTDTLGSVRTVKQVIDDGRLLVADNGGNATLVRRSGTLSKAVINVADRVTVDSSMRFALALVPPQNDADLVLEEVPNVTFADIGGYRLEWQLFNTAWFLPQNRERIYLVGRVADRCTGDVFPFPAPGGGNHPCRKDTVHSHTCGTITRNYYKQPNFGNYLINLQPGETFDGQPNEEQKSRIRMLTEVECERLQGFPDDFTRYGIINGEVREISRANRYAMLGNAVSVPVVRAVAERIRNSTVLND